jgi:hypothetical protein
MAKQNLEFASETARVGVDLGDAEPINVHISGTRTSPGPGQTIDVPLGSADAARGSGSG